MSLLVNKGLPLTSSHNYEPVPLHSLVIRCLAYLQHVLKLSHTTTVTVTNLRDLADISSHMRI